VSQGVKGVVSMPSEEYWEKMVRKLMEREELSSEDVSDLDLSPPEPYTEEELDELYRQYNK